MFQNVSEMMKPFCCHRITTNDEAPRNLARSAAFRTPAVQSLQSASFQHVLGSFWKGNSGDALHKSSPLRGSKAQSQ